MQSEDEQEDQREVRSGDKDRVKMKYDEGLSRGKRSTRLIDRENAGEDSKDHDSHCDTRCRVGKADFREGLGSG